MTICQYITPTDVAMSFWICVFFLERGEEIIHQVPKQCIKREVPLQLIKNLILKLLWPVIFLKLKYPKQKQISKHKNNVIFSPFYLEIFYVQNEWQRADRWRFCELITLKSIVALFHLLQPKTINRNNYRKETCVCIWEGGEIMINKTTTDWKM